MHSYSFALMIAGFNMQISKRMTQVAMAAGGAGFGPITNGLQARLNAIRKLREWRQEPIIDYQLLAKLCDHPNPSAFGETMTDEHIHICKLLDGPHGYAIYKMLLIKRGLA
jgi:hypothetical protein